MKKKNIKKEIKNKEEKKNLKQKEKKFVQDCDFQIRYY